MEISSFYTWGPKITIIWCRLPEIWNTADIIFRYFGTFFALLSHYWPRKWKFWRNFKKVWRYYPITHVYHELRSYDVWFQKYKARQTKLFVIWSHFFWPLTLLTTWIIKVLKKRPWRYYHFTFAYHK